MTDRNRNPSDRPSGEDAQPEPSDDETRPEPIPDKTQPEPAADATRPKPTAEQAPSDATAAETQAKPTEDEVWRDLVSRLEGKPGDFDDGPVPDSGVRTGPAHPSEHGPTAAEHTAGTHAGGQSEDLGGPRDYSPPPEPDGFMPEEPPSLAGAQPLSVLAWVGAIGAPLALLISALFWRSAPWAAVFGMLLVFLASTAYLLVRLPGERDNDGDDGAVV